MRASTIAAVLAAVLAIVMAATLHAGAAAAAATTVDRAPASSWADVGPAAPEDRTTVTVGLHRPDGALKELENAFWAVSEPGSPNYGQHLSVAELKAMLGAPDGDARTVVAWAHAAGADSTEVSATGDYVFVTAGGDALRTMFGVELHKYSLLLRDGRTMEVLRARGAAVGRMPRVAAVADDGVDALIDIVHSLTELPPPPTVLPTVGSSDDPGVDTTPDVIRNAYNGPAADAYTPSDGSGIAVAEFEQAYFFPSDVLTFEKHFNIPQQNITRIVGKNDPKTGYLGEASLDTQYISLYGLATWVISQDQFDMVQYGNTVLATSGAPKVQSVSWGSQESGFDMSQREAWNAEFQKLGAAGFTVLAASGDSGTDHSGIFSCGHFEPGFPASSPYLTAVGGTYLPTSAPAAAADGTDEVGWALSGGGFSNTFARPSYQDAAVTKYLGGSGLPDQQYWNKTGRGIPDVAALSTNFQIYIQQSLGPLSGTSAATPTFGTLVACANAERSKAGKSPLGFINPVLYKAGSAGIGTDVVSGNNKDPSCPAGFPAVKGWDAITGLATPDWPTLKATLTA